MLVNFPRKQFVQLSVMAIPFLVAVVEVEGSVPQLVEGVDAGEHGCHAEVH